MQTARSFLTPRGRLKPQPFIYGAVAIYLLGVLSQWLTVPDVLTRAGLWPFIAAQLVLIWLWFVVHAKRLHDSGRTAGLAAGVALLYVLSLALLLIVAYSFFNTSDGLMANASATSALGLILLFYIVATLLGSMQYDLAWVVVAILTLLAILPIVVTVVFTFWTATRPSAATAGAETH